MPWKLAELGLLLVDRGVSRSMVCPASVGHSGGAHGERRPVDNEIVQTLKSELHIPEHNSFNRRVAADKGGKGGRDALNNGATRGPDILLTA